MEHHRHNDQRRAIHIYLLITMDKVVSIMIEKDKSNAKKNVLILILIPLFKQSYSRRF